MLGRLTLLLVALLLLVLFRLVLPPARTVFAISARTETLTVRVVNEEAAAFGLRRALLVPVADGAPVCVEDVQVSPRAGATVQYARFARERASIVIDERDTDLAPLHAVAGTAPPSWAGRIAPPVQLVLDPASNTCTPTGTVRLPVSGTLVTLGEEPAFGDTPAAPRLALLSGAVQTLVRATEWTETQDWRRWPDWVIGTALELLGLGQQDELFSLGRTEIPPGGAVRGAAQENGAPADWSGFADLDFADPLHRGFPVEASSYAAAIDVLLPPMVARRGQAEAKQHLSLSLTDRFGADPGLKLVVVSVAFLAAVAEFYRTFIQKDVRENGKKGD